MNPFKYKKIRSCWDNTSKKRWFSAVDICAVITSSDYDKARNYWKWLKSKIVSRDIQENQNITIYYQLEMQAKDGKLRFTDVMDAEGVIRLIQACPSPKAKEFKAWITRFAAKDSSAVDRLAMEIYRAASKIKHKIGNLLKTIVKKEFCLFDAAASSEPKQMLHNHMLHNNEGTDKNTNKEITDKPRPADDLLKTA